MRIDRFNLAKCAGVLLVTGLSATPAPAAVSSYWRFEDALGDGAADSVGSRNLGLTGSVASAPIPPTTGDAGIAFGNPVPQTGAANAAAANFGSRTGHFSVATGTAPLSAPFSGNFTFEAYVNLAVSEVGAAYIGGKWNSTGNQRSWGLGVAGSGGNTSNTTTIGSGPAESPRELFLAISSDGLNGGNARTTGAGVALTAGRDYYVGVSYAEPTSAAANDGTITFYVQDLETAGAPLQAIPVTTGRITYDTAGGTFDVGTLNVDASLRWNGLIDEARFSDSVLPQSQLLAVVPEPAGVGLIVAVGGLLAARRRRA